MIWNEQAECENRGQIKQIQLERLQQTVRRAYDNVPFYRRRLDEAGVTPDDIRSLADIQKIPFTVKNDLRDNYPYGLFAVPLKEVVRLHASSGTTGKPIVAGYTKNDLENWSEMIARIVMQAGGGPEDVAQICFGYGLFTGGFGLHYGLEKVGATVVPASSGNTEKQLMLMKDFGTTILVSTPSYALYISEVAEELGIDIKKDLKVRIGMFGGEGTTAKMAQELENRWGMLCTENYGLTEVVGPGVAGECEHKCGMHINDDFFLVEVINPETGEVLPEGSFGELVITPLTKEAMPVLRYRTKDLTRILYDKCACGRTTPRIEKIQGRSDDMLIIKGVNVFPSQVESVLIGMQGISPYYQIIVRKKGFTDDMEIQVELADTSLLEKFSELEKLERSVKHNLKTVLGIETKVRLVEPKTIERTAGKSKKVLDLRDA